MDSELRTINRLEAINPNYFDKDNDIFFEIVDRKFYIARTEELQHYMIETAHPWRLDKGQTTVYVLKAFSKDEHSIVSIGTYAMEKDAFNVMAWLRATKTIIEDYGQAIKMQEYLSEIFAKPIY